jgi:endonuclease YncB( thermonuclease family)
MKNILLILSLTLLAAPGFAKKKAPATQTIYGIVDHCHDGDTCTVFSDTNKISVRFSGIDTPEISQTDGKKARDFTENLVKGKEVKLLCDGKSFNRVTCTVFENDKDVNAEIIKAGYAFDVPKYSHGKYRDLMLTAQNQRLGIWKGQPVSPFCFRHKKHKACQNNPTFVER